MNITESINQKKSVTFAVTDSGIGGLSVAAELVAQLKARPVFPQARIVFYNALFDNASGYNRLKTHQDKVRIFDAALEGLNRYVQPDLLLIACNTLSVIYPETQFSRQVAYPVVGILEAGVKLILHILNANTAAMVMIFATPITVVSNYFPEKLAAAGIAPVRVVQQACPELVGSIERGWDSDETKELIDGYVQQALSRLNDSNSSIVVSFNCTHFGYARELWEQAFQKYRRTPAMFLNPGTGMLNFLQGFPVLSATLSRISAEVVSMVEISNSTIQQIQPLLEKTSPDVARALRKYKLKADLFEWRNFVKK